MNTSLELGTLNSTLRIAIWCFSPTFWFEPDPSGLGVAWHGVPAWDFADMSSRIGLRYEIVTELPEPEDDLYEDMLALMKGMADISIDFWGITYERSKLVDFSYPETYIGVYIYSGTNKDFIHADLVMGVFDAVSYWCLISALVAMAIVSSIMLAMENRKRTLYNSILYVFGNAFNQGLNDLIVPKTTILGRSLMTLFSLYNYVICLMYGSVIMSLLISGSQPPGINSLEDLNKTENLDIRIILEEKSHVVEFLTGANMLTGFEHRVDLIDRSEIYEPRTWEKVLKRSHVMINDKGTFEDILCTINMDANMTVANLEDFRASR